MACTYTYNGKQYTEQEFREQLTTELDNPIIESTSIKGDLSDPHNTEDNYIAATDELLKGIVGLKSKVENFLSKIGVRVEQVETLGPNVNAQADVLNKIIKVVSGQENPNTLPEEAAHFFVNLLDPNSSLYKDMIANITSYDIYKDVLQAYSNNPSYRINGKPDFEKLKKEAIGKLIAQVMVDSSIGVDNKSKKAEGWWSKLWDFVRSIFVRERVNPFMKAGDAILNSQIEGLRELDTLTEDNIMFQLTSSNTPENNYNRLKETNDKLIKQDTTKIDPESGAPIQKYFLDGKELTRRVTDLAKNYYKKLFGTNVITDEKKELYNLYADKGTAIHSDLEEIYKRYIDESGKLRNKPNIQTTIKTSQSIYDLLEKNLSDRLAGYIQKYGPEVRFMSEVKVADPSRNIAGTIDFMVLKPNGRVDILDWKSSDFQGGSIKNGVPWYKEDAYTIQLDEYAKILKSNYNIDVDLKRAIPIRAIFGKNATTNKFTELTGIEMGSHMVSQIPEGKEYLLPVSSRNESSGIKQLDNLLDKLRSLYQEIKDRKVTLDDKFAKSEELSKIKKAITGLQVQHSINGLLDNGNLLLSNIEKAFNGNTMTVPKAQTYYKELGLYTDLTSLVYSTDNPELAKKIFDGKEGEVTNLGGRAIAYTENLKNYLLVQGNKAAAEVGIKNIEELEKGIGWWSGLIRTISQSPNKTVRTFYSYLKNFQNEIYKSRDVYNNELSTLSNKLKEWGKSKGLTNDKLFDGILEIDDKGRWNGQFIYKYNKQYRDLKKQYIDERNSQALEKLLDLGPEAKAKFDKKLESFNKWLSDTQFSLDNDTNDRIKQKKYDEWNYRNNVFDDKYKSLALLNYNNGIEGKQEHQSTKWKALQEPGNAPLKEVYDYFQSMLNHADRGLGMIDNTGRFIPNVENDKLSMWAQYGKTSILNLKGFFESFEYKTNNTFGEIDPVDGKRKKSVPKLFLNNLGASIKDDVTGETYTDFSLKSKDLFNVFSLWGKHIAEYEYMAKLEDVGHLMVKVEEIKNKHLHKGKDGKYIPASGNQDNIDYLQDFIDYYVYGQKVKDDNQWEFNLMGKQYSGKKAVQGVIRYMGTKTLAFNTLSIASNYVGGKFNTAFQAAKGKVMDHRDWAFGETAMHTDKGKAFINYFDVFLEDQTFHKAKQLSVYESVKLLTWDKLFIGQEYTDKLIQYTVLAAMTKSHGIVDGEIVNLKEYAQNKNGYQNIYNLPLDEQKKLRQTIKEETDKLKDTNSLWALSKIEGEGKEAKLVIPGLNRSSQSVMKFRQDVKSTNKKILGNANSDDVSRYRMTTLGQALGQFRNWMPPLIDERFGELRYVQDSQTWEEGKLRSLFGNYFGSSPTEDTMGKRILEILTKHIATLAKDFVGLTSTGNLQNRAKILYAKQKAKNVEAGLPFDISEHEFIELHISNVKSMLMEMRLIVAFSGLIFALSGGFDDDKKKQDPGAKYVTRMLDRFDNELLFYYLPTSFTQIIKSPIPVVGLMTDITDFFTSLAGQGYASLTGNERLDKKYKPTKYLFKDVPIAKEIYSLGTVFDEDMRKSYEVTK